MIYIKPEYYGKFTCIASQCEDTCCAGWEIGIDPQSLKKYEATKGVFGNRLHNSIQWKRQSFQQYEGRCIFLNEENLCDMYAEAGPEMLCETCKCYPRHKELFEGREEEFLAISCPEVARIILRTEQPVKLEVTNTKENETATNHNKEELFEVREVLLRLLQDRSYDIQTRMSIALGLGHDLQSRINHNKRKAIGQMLKRYEDKTIRNYLAGKVRKYEGPGWDRYRLMKQATKVVSHLKVLNRDWYEDTQSALHSLYRGGKEEYTQNVRKFQESVGRHSSNAKQYEIWMEQLAVYFIMNYFAGAIYDDEAEQKVKFAMYHCLMIQELWMARWMRNLGVLEEQDVVQVVYQYAREVEHLDDNIEKIEKWITKKKCCELDNLMICCMN